MRKEQMGTLISILLFSFLFPSANSLQDADTAAMLKLKDTLKKLSLDWSDADPCKWKQVSCQNNRIDRIQIGNQGLSGTLPPDLKNLTALTIFEVMSNDLTGPLPSLSGLSNLQRIYVNGNNFSSIPLDFFQGMSQLSDVSLDGNAFQSWELPPSLMSASALTKFSASGTNIGGTIPQFFNGSVFVSLQFLNLAFNYLEGELPSGFSGLSSIQNLLLNNQQSNTGLNGTIAVLQNMTGLTQVWLQSNQFTGPIPDLTKLSLTELNLRDNQLTGVVPLSLTALSSLQKVNLSNNLLQGPTPLFGDSVAVEMTGNRFCLSVPGKACDSRVSALLSIMEDFGYPLEFAKSWKGNDPCNSWMGVMCSSGEGNIMVINFQTKSLVGTISSNFSSITSLQKLILSDNNITGTIPTVLTTLASLTLLDVSNNNLYGKVPSFKQNVQVITDGNPNIGKDPPPPSASPSDKPTDSGGGNSSDQSNKNSATGKIVGSVIGGVAVLGILGLAVFVYGRRQKRYSKVQGPNTMVIHPRHSGDEDAVKISIAASSANSGAENLSHTNSGRASGLHVIEAGNLVISIQVLRNVTNNFSEENILGRGGFGTVYKGELHDGTKIAVKRMESGAVTGKGLAEFKSEIAVLTKVRHRHLVALLGYCLDGNEKLLVYEYMPQGTLSRYLFNWKEEGLKPFEWTRRLAIALDVARGVEYLHGLAHQSFIHRDLKPSNILLGDDMRAKVADFGLVRLAPEGKASIETRLAGTFGYLAPEYAVTGRVTTKVDVFSFGVILLEIITGRKALDETQPEDRLHLVTWFRRMYINKDTFPEVIDPTIKLDEETLASIGTVAELASHCTAREPYQRPDMGHVVNVLSSLVELWKPSEPDSDDMYDIDLDMTLPQALKKWQAFEGSSMNESSSSFLTSGDNTQSSIPTRPHGFAESFTSQDGR